MFVLLFKQDEHNFSEIGTHELYNFIRFKTPDVYNYDLFKFIRFPMSDRPNLFEEPY